MDEKQALLEKFLRSRFDIDTFRDFIARFFYKPDMKHSPKSKAIEEQFKDYIESFTEIAKYKDDDKKVITFMAVEIIKERSVERARNMQRNYMAKFLEKNEYDAAIVAFYNENEKNWKLSFVRLDYSFSEKGILKEITPAKRYSYLVGEEEPNHTARKQFYTNLSNLEKNPTVDKLEEIFDIEKVTTDFFNRYKEKYLALKEYLEGVEEFLETAKKFSFTSEEFAKKLMGQIAFLYFLQKKGWLGVKIVPQSISMDDFRKIWGERKLEQERDILKRVFVKHDEETLRISNSKVLALTIEEADILAGCFLGTKYEQKWGEGNRKFIRHLFESCQKSSTQINFFHDWLEPLFYTALNQKRGNNQYFKKFNCKIPFLNVGLFEHMYGNEEWQKKDFHIPNDIFSNKEETGILDTFDIYNFTMNEDEPLEKEVAVDPEMLGKIFENLLDVKDRKSKGAFYTPREIVHYMCKESLINYLVNETGIEHTDIDNFIQLGEFIKDEDRRTIKRKETDYLMPKPIIEKLADVDKALENVKVADPAVGSGAFPLGMLNEIVKARDTLTEYFLIGKDKFEADEIRYERSMYNLKKNAMLNSIHAVDIEPSAVDITKLRLWLSIIVDNDDEVIHELPNLDYKIMTGNSLIEEFEGMKLFDENLIVKDMGNKNAKTVNTGNIYTLFGSNRENILKKVVELRENYFKEKERANKEKIRADIERLEWDLIKETLTESGKADKIKELEKLNKEKRKPYFLWKWNFLDVFQEKGGFDIMIGNPPYLGIQGIQKLMPHLAEKYKKIYKSATGYYDLYVLFVENGLNLIKTNGILNYIMPHKWVNSEFGKGLRSISTNNMYLSKFISFGSYQVFNASTYTSLVWFKKQENKIVKYYEFDKDILNNIQLELELKKISDITYNLIESSSLNENAWIFANNRNSKIIERMKKQPLKVEDIFSGVLKGITTGDNKSFFIYKAKENGQYIYGYSEVINDYINIEKGILKPLLKGSDIKKYQLKYEDSYTIYPYKKVNSKTEILEEKELIEKYPKCYEYLLSISERLKNRGTEKMNYPKWYSLWNFRKIENFEDPKIITPDICYGNSMSYDEKGFYYSDTCYGFVKKNEFKEDYKFYLALLNSNLLWFYLQNAGSVLRGGYFRFKTKYLEPFPMPKIDDISITYPFITIVDKIILAKEQNPNADTTDLENQIDEMVYDLYELTEEEKEIVRQYKR